MFPEEEEVWRPRCDTHNHRHKYNHKPSTYERNIEALSGNSCLGKAMRIKYSECVSVVLVIQHAMRMRHVVICDLSESTLFLHIIS